MPADTACASHPTHGRLRRPFPIGPVVRKVGDQPELLHEAPDSPAIRRALIDLVSDIYPRGIEPLQTRDAAVVRELRRLGEPRAIVHLDRIDATQMINESRAALATGMPRNRFLDALPADTLVAPIGSTEFLEQFSVPGRLLLFSSVAIGFVIAIVAMLLDVGLVLRVASVGVGVGVAALWLRVGVFVMGRIGVPFRNPRGRTGRLATSDVCHEQTKARG